MSSRVMSRMRMCDEGSEIGSWGWEGLASRQTRQVSAAPRWSQPLELVVQNWWWLDVVACG